MDTRTKILTVDHEQEFQTPVLLVTGRFDILRMELVQQLAEAKTRTDAQSLVVVIQPATDERVPAASRAEMAAALRVVDYVFIAGPDGFERLTARLQPLETLHLEADDERRTRQLIEHVQRRKSS